MQSSWHKGSTEDAVNFRRTRQKPETAVISQLDAAVANQIAENRQKLEPILSIIIYCGTHDISPPQKRQFWWKLRRFVRFSN